jgi:hypothetical protein
MGKIVRIMTTVITDDYSLRLCIRKGLLHVHSKALYQNKQMVESTIT